MTEQINIKHAIITAIKNAKTPCNVKCEDCPFDKFRFNFGFSWCKAMYRENLINYVEKHIIEVDKND